MKWITLLLAVVALGGCGEGPSSTAAREKEPPGWQGKPTAVVLAEAPPVEAGQVVFARRACNECHSVDGSRRTGPTLKGLWGSTVALRDGTEVTADDEYIRASILKPTHHVVQGYRPEMPDYSRMLTPGEVYVLIAYVRSLGEEPAATQPAP